MAPKKEVRLFNHSFIYSINFQYLRKKVVLNRLNLNERKKRQLEEPAETSEQGTFYKDFRNDDDFVIGQQEIDRCIGR